MSGPPPPPGMAVPQTESQPQQQPQPQHTQAQPKPQSSNTANERCELLIKAATWYTEVHKLVLIPCHYPVPTGTSDNSYTCSCGNSLCEDQAKHPAVRAGYHINSDLQVTSGRDAQEVWERYPYNIAVLLGQRRGLFAFDVDPRHGGDESLERLKTDLAGVIDFTKTFHYNTSSGGSHYYFKLDPDDTESWKIISSKDTQSWPRVSTSRELSTLGLPMRQVTLLSSAHKMYLISRALLELLTGKPLRPTVLFSLERTQAPQITLQCMLKPMQQWMNLV